MKKYTMEIFLKDSKGVLEITPAVREEGNTVEGLRLSGFEYVSDKGGHVIEVRHSKTYRLSQGWHSVSVAMHRDWVSRRCGVTPPDRFDTKGKPLPENTDLCLLVTGSNPRWNELILLRSELGTYTRDGWMQLLNDIKARYQHAVNRIPELMESDPTRALAASYGVDVYTRYELAKTGEFTELQYVKYFTEE